MIGQVEAGSRTGMVATPHRAASEAGQKILSNGGNAIEAVVAAGAALSVLYPHFCGLGGDAIWLVCDKHGNAECFLGIGQAPLELPPLQSLPARGPGSLLTSACLVDSWQAVLDFSKQNWDGAKALPELLEDAIHWAETGFDASPSQTFWHDFRAGGLRDWPGFENTFVAHGLQRQPDLARTLRRIAAHGAREFYEGSLAADIAAGLQALGSPLTLRDLARTGTRRQPPLALPYRKTVLLAPPPPTQGVSTLGIMGILAHMPMADFDPSGGDYYHHLVEAVKQAFLDRNQIADPDFSKQPIADWLSAQRLADKAAAISPCQALAWPQVFQTGDTSCLAAVDSEGRSVSMLQSLYFDWGSGCVIGDTGILWQNRGAAFSLDPESPNMIAPAKRPFYTLNPGMALKDGRPHLLYGTQGADGQPQTLSLLISLMIDHGLDPLAALSRPRFLLGRTFSDSRDTLKVESNLGALAIQKLADLGHEVAQIDAFSPLGGQAGIIRIADDGEMTGAHDPRSDGCALGL